MVTNDELITAECTCKAGGYDEQKSVYVHSLVPLYLFTLLLTSGYLAEHILLELSNVWDNSWDLEVQANDKLSTLKESVVSLIKTTGVYEIFSMMTNCSMKQLLNKYNVGTEKKRRPKYAIQIPN